MTKLLYQFIFVASFLFIGFASFAGVTVFSFYVGDSWGFLGFAFVWSMAIAAVYTLCNYLENKG